MEIDYTLEGYDRYVEEQAHETLERGYLDKEEFEEYVEQITQESYWTGLPNGLFPIAIFEYSHHYEDAFTFLATEAGRERDGYDFASGPVYIAAEKCLYLDIMDAVKRIRGSVTPGATQTAET